MATFSFNKPQAPNSQQQPALGSAPGMQFQSPLVALPPGGKNVLDIDIDSLEEKAWRKAGFGLSAPTS
jgi:hypothetical protein